MKSHSLRHAEYWHGHINAKFFRWLSVTNSHKITICDMCMCENLHKLYYDFVICMHSNIQWFQCL